MLLTLAIASCLERPDTEAVRMTFSVLSCGLNDLRSSSSCPLFSSKWCVVCSLSLDGFIVVGRFFQRVVGGPSGGMTPRTDGALTSIPTHLAEGCVMLRLLLSRLVTSHQNRGRSFTESCP